MRRLVVAGVGALMAAIGALVVAQNQPGYSLVRLVAPERRPAGHDIYISDHYLIFDPVPVLVNFVIFAALIYATALWWRRSASPQGQR